MLRVLFPLLLALVEGETNLIRDCSPSTEDGMCSPLNGTAGTRCFLACVACNAAPFDPAIYISNPVVSSLCNSKKFTKFTKDEISTIATTAVIGLANIQGQFFLDGPGEIEENATEAISYLLINMPRRDIMLLGQRTFEFVDFLIENVRLALRTRPFSQKFNVPWEVFLDSVLPYAVLDEKRDITWHSRLRFSRLKLWTPPAQNNDTLPRALSSATNLTDAMHIVTSLIPKFSPAAAFNVAANNANYPVYEYPTTWRSETAPAMLSPEQQISYGGGSCTGTAIMLVAAARAVGIPARITGCSESIVRGDDHHWVEFWDEDLGPFKDNWHTKEGVSKGNAGGPWDAASGPMRGCLRGVIPHSTMDTLWAASWKSEIFLPTQWANSTMASEWSFVGGVNRCGAYCTTWGCGVNSTDFYNQAQCGPLTSM